MTCAAGVSRVEKAAKRLPGVQEARVSLLANQGVFTFDPAQTTPGAIAAAIEKIGYDAAPTAGEDTQAPEHEAEGRDMGRRFGVAAILTVPVLLGSMGRDFGLLFRGLQFPAGAVKCPGRRGVRGTRKRPPFVSSPVRAFPQPRLSTDPAGNCMSLNVWAPRQDFRVGRRIWSA